MSLDFEIREISDSQNLAILSPNTFQEFPLRGKKKLSPNVAIYRFALPSSDSLLGLPIGQHITIRAILPVDSLDGTTSHKEFIRSYTPISSDLQRGFFDLLIKTYPTGNISRMVDSLKIGDRIAVRGPKGAMVYTPNMASHICMIAGGTGISPMLQIIRAVIRGRQTGDKTNIDLIFANVNEEDILMRADLDELAREDAGFRVHYVLNNPPSGWNGGVGFVSAAMIQKWFPKPANKVKVLLCGPPPMIGAMKKITEDVGFAKLRIPSRLEDQVFSF